jgi:hypothetical protein
LGLLHIPVHLADRTNQSLHLGYQKYKAYLEATQTYQRMAADGAWSRKKLTAVDLIELFVSKSFWHSHLKPTFSKVANYPLMVQWLENSLEESVSDVDVWGMEKASYNYKDLKAWLEESAGKAKKKGKAKVAKDDGGDKKNKKKKKGKMQVQ